MEIEEASSSSQPASPPAWTQASIHVRGVPLLAREEDLKNHFEQYGQVVWAGDVQREPRDSDGKAACVVFADPAAVNWALVSWEKNNHIILGKMVEVTSFSDRLQRWIEMYDLPPSTTCSLLKDYFEKFGVVTEAFAAPNGWGYVVFNRVTSAHEVLRTERHLFCGTEVKVLRPSPRSNAFLDSNASQRDLAGATSSAIPYASRVIPIPLYIDMRCSTPYDAPSYIDNAPSYNQPTIAIPHTYNASTTPFSTSNNQSISATTNASGAPSITPFGVPNIFFFNRPISATSCATTNTSGAHSVTPLGAPYTSFFNRPTSTTSCANNALSINSYGAPYTPFDNQLISATINASGAPSVTPFDAPYMSFYNHPINATSYANNAPYTPSNNRSLCAATNIYGTPSVTPFGAPYTFFHNRPINAASYANSAPYAPSHNQSISATTNASGAPSFIPFNAPYTSFYNRPINTTSYAKSAPNYPPFYNQPITNTPHAYGAPFTSLPLHNPMSTTQNANTAPNTFFYDPVNGPLCIYDASHLNYYPI